MTYPLGLSSSMKLKYLDTTPVVSMINQLFAFALFSLVSTEQLMSTDGVRFAYPFSTAAAAAAAGLQQQRQLPGAGVG